MIMIMIPITIHQVPSQLLGRTYDCVVMMGGFAAGHIPLAR